MHSIDAELLETLVGIRNEFIDYVSQANQYSQLTQSYVQKPFTIFNLFISSVCASRTGENSKLESILVSNTQNELIETQLNIQYLLLNPSILQTTVADREFSRYEIGLVRFLEQNECNRRNVMELLPSIPDLYYVIDHPQECYPFGVIKAYEILSMLIRQNGESSELKKLTIDELEKVINAAAHQGNDVDEVADATWKYVIAQLNRCEIDSATISTEQMANMIEHLRNITCCYRSPDLRQTATEAIATITSYFKRTENLAFLIEFAELLLSLLRDDDAHVRNRTSEIVMDLIRENGDQSQFEKGELMAAWTVLF